LPIFSTLLSRPSSIFSTLLSRPSPYPTSDPQCACLKHCSLCSSLRATDQI
jgi:hypothetical protein